MSWWLLDKGKPDIHVSRLYSLSRGGEADDVRDLAKTILCELPVRYACRPDGDWPPDMPDSEAKYDLTLHAGWTLEET